MLQIFDGEQQQQSQSHYLFGAGQQSQVCMVGHCEMK